MKLSIYGAGYVGLVSGICFAELGHTVCCVDVDKEKIIQLQQGRLPIFEENLEEMLRKNQDAERIHFTNDFQLAIDYAAIQMIAVGTPPKIDGSADLQYIEAVANKIGDLITSYRCIINKSTVPIGTAEQIQLMIAEKLRDRHCDFLFDVVSNPEFLCEGRAVKDFLSPDRIIVGTQTKRAFDMLQELYRPLIAKGHAFISMDPASAELTKYAANAFLATKVSFMNEISQIAERTGANIHAVKKGIGSDSRINEKFLNAGCGFGGSCFPKDVAALKNISMSHGYEPHILNAVLRINDQQQQLLFKKISLYFNRELSNKIIALWGLSFKPNTDDVRCASSRVLMELLWNAGAKVQAFDPLAMPNIRRVYHQQLNLMLCDNPEETLQGADALVVVTEWSDFQNPNFVKIKQLLRHPVIFDGRNMYDGSAVQENGLKYIGIGC